jgi:hypothetical protein
MAPPMTNIALLDTQAHRDLHVETGASARFGDAQRFVPVVVGEFVHAAAHYPLLFSKNAETGGFYCGAMLGIDEGCSAGLFSPRATISPSIWIIPGWVAAKPCSGRMANLPLI